MEDLSIRLSKLLAQWHTISKMKLNEETKRKHLAKLQDWIGLVQMDIAKLNKKVG